jgi:multidrug efflux pump subunit AcrB
MNRLFRTILFWTLILSACSTGLSSPPPVPLSTTEAPTLEISTALPTTAGPDPTFVATVSTPHIDQPPDGNITAPPNAQDCAYQWAYQDLPELSSSLQGSIQALQAEAQANAFAFGENCVTSDGTIVSFSAMETDFNVTLQVNDIANESDLGEWIVKVMQVITAIPAEQIVGPRPGRVSLTFQSSADQKVINFYIDQYQALPAGLSNSEIYQALQIPQ